MGAWYCSREDVKSALDAKETARSNVQIDRTIEAASRSVEGALHRKFYPQSATRYFDWPSDRRSRPWRLWLAQHELISVSTLVAGGVTIAASDYFLRPDDGPPFTFLELDLSSNASFGGGTTPQRDIAITGLFGYSNDELSVGSLSAQLAAPTSSTASLTWTTSRIGVGNILRIDNERMVIAERTLVDSTQNLQTSLTASNANVTVAVTTGSAFAVDEIILIDSERMLIVDIAGNNLTVKRAWDGSVLAAHNQNVDIFTLTGVELLRGQFGTTAAVHESGAIIYQFQVPGGVKDLIVAESIAQFEQESAGYARVAGSGESAREVSGRGITDLRTRVYNVYGRKMRMAVV